MSVLVYVEAWDGPYPKSALEAVYYAGKTAALLNTEAVAVSVGNAPDDAAASLGEYGAAKVLQAGGERLRSFDSRAYTKIAAAAAEKSGATLIIFPNNYTCKAVAPRLSARLKAGLITGVISLPEMNGGKLSVKRTAYSGKAFACCTVNTPQAVLALQPNAITPEKQDKKAVVEKLEMQFEEKDFSVTVKETKKASGKVPLTEASVIVSGGRGMKGPENWKMLEEMASALGAALACSKPVADMGWRPHEEHVGQTGITVRPNLYIAVGISGAIQHLAGVNGSKCMVVINKDPEAPFFKAADYGIVGDAFEVVPKLTEAFRKMR